MKNNKISSTSRKDSGKQTPCKALVVEDDKVIGFLYCKFLERLGLQVEIVKNGEAALKCTLEADYDVMLLDLGLPDVSGEFVLSAIRTRELGISKHLSIIINTAHGNEAKLIQCLEMGADAVFQKPLPFEILKQTLEKLVGNSASVE